MPAFTIPEATQLVTFKPNLSDQRLLGHAGHIVNLTYSFTLPGGPDQLAATLQCPLGERTPAIDPGRIVVAWRGAHIVWIGKMNEPAPGPGGWAISAEGAGAQGADMLAVYTSTWPAAEPDESINNAIGRGLKWANPGVGSPAGAWFGQAFDSGSQTIADVLNLICTRGGLTWYVNPQPGGIQGTDLSVFALPTMVNRLLVVTSPVARTLNGNFNTIYIRYQITADDTTGTGTVATFGLTVVTNAADIAAHQPMETYIDLSSAGVMTAAAAQAVGSQALKVYQRVTFAGPFTVMPGQLLTTTGQAIDLGTDQAGTVARLILTDFGYGGEVTETFPITFLVGGYSYDDQARIATITPFQSLFSSLSSLLSMESSLLTPAAAADSSGGSTGGGSLPSPQPMITA